jgi:hypothetical protein
MDESTSTGNTTESSEHKKWALSAGDKRGVRK